MRYEKLTIAEFFERVCSEEAARDLMWRCRFEGKDFICPRCTHEEFYQHNSRPEIRQCRLCDKQVRAAGRHRPRAHQGADPALGSSPFPHDPGQTRRLGVAVDA